MCDRRSWINASSQEEGSVSGDEEGPLECPTLMKREAHPSFGSVDSFIEATAGWEFERWWWWVVGWNARG